MNNHRREKLLRVGLFPLIMLGTTSVLADEVSEEKFTLARMAIEEAQEVDADASAGSELTLAEQKLQQAVEYNDEGREEVAERLLHQSMLHAELAEVEAMQADADLTYNALSETLDSLETELRRQ